MEAAPQQEHTVDREELSKGVAQAVWEFDSQGGFLPKVRRAWNGHPAAPRMVVAGRNRVSTSRSETQHTYICSDHTWTGRGRNTSRIRAKRIFVHNPLSLEIKKLKETTTAMAKILLTQGMTASISSSVRWSLEASVGSACDAASLLGKAAVNSFSRR